MSKLRELRCTVCWRTHPITQITHYRTGPRGNLGVYWTCVCGAPQPTLPSRDANGYYDPPLPLEPADGRA